MLKSPAFISIVIALAVSRAVAASERPVDLLTFGTHSRLVLPLEETTQVKWKETQAGFELFLPGLSLTDLGAPLGAEADWAAQAGRVSDSRLQGLSFSEKPEGVTITGRWRYPEGAQALAAPRMERFDYRDRAGGNPRYVVDFWVKPGLTRIQEEARKQRLAREAELQRQRDQSRTRNERRLAYQKVKSEIEDVTRFCREPASPGKDIFLNFVPVHEPLVLSKWLPVGYPDSEYEYLSPRGEDKDAKYLRLALNLYHQGKHALVLRTADFFDSELKNSSYEEEMRFLRANALLKLGYDGPALQVLRDLMVTRPNSPAALYSGIFLTQRSFAQGAGLESLESFLWLINRYPFHSLTWLFHLGVAESSFHLKQTERAVKEYEWVVENARDTEAQAEAAYRIGDVYQSRNQHEQALAAYFQAFTKYPNNARQYPTVHLNRAESLYWLGQYERAEQAFKQFLKDFPSHSEGWRATYRLGEIESRRPGPEAVARARQWFSETINRYPFSTGATLARAVLIPCEDHAGFDLAAADHFFSHEASTLAAEDDLTPERYREFASLQHLRSLIAFGATDRAIELAIRDLRVHNRSEAKPFVSDALRTLFRRSILAKLDEGKPFDALAFYRSHSDQIPPAREGSDPIDSNHLLRLSRAAADLGLGSLAQSLALAHAKEAGPATSSTRGPAGEEPAAAPREPKGEPREMEERLRLSSSRFTQARALWAEKGMNASNEVRQLLDGVGEESEHSAEKEIILGLIEEKSGKSASALVHAARAQLLSGNPAASSRLAAWLAGLQARSGDPRAAIEGLKRLSVKADAKAEAKPEAVPADRFAALGLPPVGSRDELLLLQGELLGRIGRWGEAAKVYAQAVEEGRGGNQALYEWSRVLRKTGSPSDTEKADEVLKTLAASKTEDFWKKLARQATGDPKKP